MLPRCWQAVTSPTARSSLAASAPSCGRGPTSPASPPTSSGRATTSSLERPPATDGIVRAGGRPVHAPTAARSSRRRRRPAWRETTTLPLVDPVVRVAVRAARCAGRSPAAARRRPTPPRRTHGDAVVGAARPPRPARRSACSACWRRRRCRRRSSTRCSPRRSSSPPTTSASATVGIGIAGVDRAGRHRARAARRRARRPHRPAARRDRRWRSPRPLVTALGALAPTFPFLVATQALGRPLGLALDFLVAVVAAEEMPRNSRAYAVSVLAMASGLGAGVAVIALPLADLSAGAWRLVYLVALIWLRRGGRHRPPAPRDPALRAPARRRAADRPPPVRRARRRGPAGQPVRRPGEPVPERLPQGRARLLGDDDRRSSRSSPPRRPASA